MKKKKSKLGKSRWEKARVIIPSDLNQSLPFSKPGRVIKQIVRRGPGVPCFLCGEDLDVRHTYKEKPYLVCDACGIQTFIRGRDGIALFQKLIDKIIIERQKNATS